MSIRLTQTVEIGVAGYSRKFIVVVEASASRTALVALTPNGIFLFSVEESADGTSIKRQAGLPDFVKPAQVLRDIQLVNWPDSAVVNLWGEKVEFAGSSERIVYQGRKPIKIVRYVPKHHHWITAELTDTKLGYRVQIHRVSEEQIEQSQGLHQ